MNSGFLPLTPPLPVWVWRPPGPSHPSFTAWPLRKPTLESQLRKVIFLLCHLARFCRNINTRVKHFALKFETNSIKDHRNIYSCANLNSEDGGLVTVAVMSIPGVWISQSVHRNAFDSFRFSCFCSSPCLLRFTLRFYRQPIFFFFALKILCRYFRLLEKVKNCFCDDWGFQPYGSKGSQMRW
jgi:hypothetical protein